ncbi:MAG: hypothetical protein GXO96_02030 [Nitrospirae bacterium]|nr:hypothetical protein [Candidatus Manganitrophaceae bacterium]
MNTERSLDFQIAFEQRVAKIYQQIGEQFPSKTLSMNKKENLWKNLARDERKHVAILKIEKSFLKTGTRVTKPVEISPESQGKIEAMLLKYEAKIYNGINESEALHILSNLEACDKDFFLPLLKATDSKLLSQFPEYSKSFQLHERRVQKSLRHYENLGRRKTDHKPTEGKIDV